MKSIAVLDPNLTAVLCVASIKLLILLVLLTIYIWNKWGLQKCQTLCYNSHSVLVLHTRGATVRGCGVEVVGGWQRKVKGRKGNKEEG